MPYCKNQILEKDLLVCNLKKNKKMKTGKLVKEDCLLLIIDIQEKLIPVIFQQELVIKNTNILLKGIEILNVPIIVTEQYPKGLGNTCSEILLSENQTIDEKMTFSCVLTDSIFEKIKTKKQIILCGVEAHICVLKTAFDLAEKNFEVHVVADAVSSRTMDNKLYALQRLRQANIYIDTAEMVLFQLLDLAGTEEFKAISKLIK